MIKCQPFDLPREFSSVIMAAVYTQPLANAQLHLMSYTTLSTYRTTNIQKQLLLSQGTSTIATTKRCFPSTFSMSPSQQEVRKYWITAIPQSKGLTIHVHFGLPHFGKVDHAAVILLLAYKQKLESTQTTVRTVQRWSEENEARLQGFVESTNWSIIKDSASDLNEYVESVMGYINFCVDSCIPTMTVQSYPNQKPWLNRNIRYKLKARTIPFKLGDKDLYKKSRYDLEKAIKAVKRNYSERMERQYNGPDMRRMLQGLQSITV